MSGWPGQATLLGLSDLELVVVFDKLIGVGFELKCTGGWWWVNRDVIGVKFCLDQVQR